MYDYWSLENIKWDSGAGIEDLITFGINPIKQMTDLIDDMIQNDPDDKMVNINLIIRNMLENMEKCIYRFKNEAKQTDTKESTETESAESL